jgi:F0F1-type ATP synthase delta subunit
MKKGFTMNTRKRLFEDKFSFKDDTMIAVNALDLIAELSRQEALEAHLKQLQTKYETAMAMLSYKVNFNASEMPILRSYDVRA